MKKVFTVVILLITLTVVKGQVKENVKYQIVNKSGAVIDVHKASKDNNANVALWDNKKAANQQFYFIKFNDFYYIKNVNSGKALDIKKGIDKKKTNIHQYQINLTDAQKFKIVDAKDGYYYLVSAKGNYLSSETVHGQRGSNIILWSKSNVAKWKFVEVK